MNKRLMAMTKEEIIKEARSAQGHLMGQIAELNADLYKMTDDLYKMTKERNIWRIVCCVGFAAFLILGYLGVF